MIVGKDEHIHYVVKPIADALGVGFYGEDGKLKMEAWNDVGIVFPNLEFLHFNPHFKIHSHVGEHHALICFNLSGNMYVFIYYSVKANRLYMYAVDSVRLKDRVNKLSSTMTDLDLDKFVKRIKNSSDLQDALGFSCTRRFAKYVHQGEWKEI